MRHIQGIVLMDGEEHHHFPFIKIQLRLEQTIYRINLDHQLERLLDQTDLLNVTFLVHNTSTFFFIERLSSQNFFVTLSAKSFPRKNRYASSRVISNYRSRHFWVSLLLLVGQQIFWSQPKSTTTVFLHVELYICSILEI